ncbi:putative tail tubular B protein [Escherichia phage vB_EcoP_C]|uniref:Putative tail tubular B protein n=4 Tax=Vectrevirus TaxID=2732928 RepID=A0A1Q1PVF4_9CAUD|nr:putative tail tubular B protein [Escherichia phage vB_EcoP_B]YP_009789039.1 putative tail tubular B protein [Escherichia phage vB_EcoP_C]AQN31755.1 putative tail tubular B protein [Escherichia phage vB_EcoP_D]AQN32059.1 putative tail tubular B protein [Escherichia phage vB_EcoP_R]AQN31635.1 putative tail tubular B protein [Escherichia phage vB_EcoP_B]AQN31666.1 putative tail tubular B protein [Escherichia phage vB_EcoP_C]
MEVQGSLGRQIQGISQQPPAVRLDGQCTTMVNMVPDVVNGTQSRMGTTHIAKLLDEGTDNMATHHYRRGEGDEEYFFTLKKGQVPEIFDKHGRKCNVTSQDAPMTYLSEVVNPREDVQFMTIADVTFMLNRRKVVKVSNRKSPKVGDKAIVFCAYGQYGTSYSIIINGTTAASFKTPDGGSAEHVEQIRTERITSELYSKLQQWSGVNDYEIQRDGTSIFIERRDGKSFTVTTTDGAKGKDLVAIKNKVSSTDLLPSRAPAGYKVQVWPTGSKPESRYWLQAEPKEGNLVSWKETIAADVLLGFDKGTMPYIIERTGIIDGIAQFKIRQGDWEDRKVGDDLTNPMPSFIDEEVPQTIGGMFMVQNRLCFTAGEAVIASRTSYFFDFFRYTVISALATDPFDIFSDASEVYQLKHAVTLDGATVLFSDKSQFILPGDKPLEKSNALLKPVTTFEVNNKVKPVVTGESVMFATNDGYYSGVREFYTDSYSDTKKAQAITSHVNKLIEGNITNMAASTNVNRLLVTTDKYRNIIYCYDWLWQGTDRVQSAWHVWKWPVGTKVRGLFYSGELLYLLLERGDGVYLEKMDMGDALTYGLNDRIRMDRQAELVFKHFKAEDEWVSEPLPWTPTNPELLDCILIDGWDSYIGGSFLFKYNPGDNTLSTTFDMHDDSHVKAKVIVGQIYPQEFEPTPVVIRDRQDRVSYIDVPVVGLVHLNLDMYPDFSVEVKNVKSGKVRRVLASNRIGGALNNTVGYVEPREGVFRFPLRAKSTDAVYRIIVESPHTFQLRDIEWEGSYNPTKRRV